MTRTMTLAAGLLLCLGALPVAHANCGPAPQPGFAIPDGAHASRDEMSAARDNLSEYSAQVAAYAACLGDQPHAPTRNLDLGSSALLRLATVVSCFSQQVQVFQATGGGSDAGPAQCSSPNAPRRTLSYRQTRPRSGKTS